MKILVAAAEATPLSKVGGLGDVAGSLPRAIAALGHDVRVAIPYTGLIDKDHFQPRLVARFQIAHRHGPQLATISEVHYAGVTFYLVAGPPIPKAKRVYGVDIKEDGPKFIFFSLAVLGLCRALEWAPDILHANDAHTGPAVYWLGTDGLRDPFFANTASVFTIHNLVYMNNHAGRYFRDYGLAPSDAPDLPDWARDSLMGVGLAHADVINAVSPGYAREILTPEFGCGLEGLLRARRQRVSGILNGLDVAAWDPAHDPALKQRYDARHLAKRVANKSALQAELRLPVKADTPLLGVVSRLDAQKGFDMAGAALRGLLAGDIQLVVLGAGAPQVVSVFETLAADFPDKVRVCLRFDEALARRIYAGADVCLIPSHYEPCGLTQMIAMRYGAVPVVRYTGGLADTVTDYRVPRRGSGFVFQGYNSNAFARAVRRALKVYRRPRQWRALQTRGMRLNFAWTRSARLYVHLYTDALAYRQAALQNLKEAIDRSV